MLPTYFITFLKLLLLLLLPGLFWLYFFAGDKGIFKSTGKSLIPVFLMGVFVCVPAFAIEVFCVIIGKLIENSLTAFITSFMIVAPLEEYLKSLAVDIAGYSRDDEHEIKQILAWYFAAAIGFASIENVLYYLVGGSKIFFYRVLITTLAHVGCSGIIAFFLASNQDKPVIGFLLGFFLASMVHGGYDYCLNVYPVTLWGWVPFFILIVCFFEARLNANEDENEEEGG